MKTIFTTFLSIVFGFSLLNAQTTTSFRMNYDQALFDLPGNAVEGLTPNTYVFAGTNLNFLPIFGTVTQLDANGNLVWSKRYGDNSIGFQLNDIKKDAVNNEYYVCGGSESNAAVFMRLNSAGDVVVSTRFSISQADGAYLNRVVKTNDGGYIAVGYVTGYDPDGAGPEIKFSPINYVDADGNNQTEVISSPLIVKFDANGNHVWHHVTRYYTNAAKDPVTHRIYNDASFNDVVEVVDGYIAVGQYDVNQHLSRTNSDGDDATPTDALIFKTDLNGAVVYHKQVDNPSTATNQTSKFLSAINKTSAGDPIAAGGTDSGRELIMKYGAAGNFSLTYSRQFTYSSSFFGIDPVDISQIYEVNGSTDIVTMGMYVRPLAFSFTNSLHRVNAAATNNVWTRTYAFNLLTILPRGSQTSDNGHLMLSMTAGGTNYDYHVIKTDPNGITPPECAPTNITPTAAAGPTTIADPFYNAWSGTPGPNSLTVAVVNLNPNTSEQCRLIINPCTPPEAANSVTATDNEICAGESTTISASGPSSDVNYTVYTQASGGTSAGTTPLAVTPSETTTYYIETVNNLDPNCVSITRTPITITVNPAPTANASSNSPICIGQDLNLTSDAVVGGTYSWTGPNGFTSDQQNPTINSAQIINGGTYSLTIIQNGCPSNVSTIDVTISDVPVAVATSSSPVCEGGSLQLNAEEVIGGTYSWTGPNGFTSDQQNPVISPVSSVNSGTYSLTISVGSCTSNTSTADVVINANPTVSASSNSPLCFGGDLTLSSTSSTNSFTWNGPNGFTSNEQNPTINGVAPIQSGDYIVTVTDGNSCTAQETVSVTINSLPTIDNILIQNVSCFGLSDGQTEAIVSGGNAPYTYSWLPSTSTGNTASGLGAGTFTLVVTDNNTCSATETVTITEPNAIQITASSTAENCSLADGTASASATGGTGILTYTWNPGNINGQNLSGLTSGAYSVTVTDENLCSATQNVNVNAAGGPTLTIESTQDVTCFGDNNGSITVSASGGDGNYSFTWIPNVGNTESVGDLTAGSYTVTVTDGGGCGTSETIQINSPAEIQLQINSQNGLCGENAAASVIATGGTGNYTYSWTPGNSTEDNILISQGGNYSVVVSDGSGCSATESTSVTVAEAIVVSTSSTAENCNQLDGTASATATGGTGTLVFTWNPGNIFGQNISGLTAGNYTVTVTDDNACSVDQTVNVLSAGGPTLSNQTVTTISCFGLNNGSISVTASGGDGNYTYTWTPALTNSPSVSGLSAGSYTLTVTDGSNCGTSETFTISEPSELEITTSSQNSTCELANGSATVSATGGTGTYTYSWNPGNIQTATAPNLNAGTYTVVVTDQNGCSENGSVTITTTQAPTINLQTSQDVTCFGDTDGSATVSVTGGTPGYTYSWSPSGGTSASISNVAAGVYTVTVNDANSCSSTLQVTIGSPATLAVTVTSSDASCGDENGSANAFVNGGTAPYTYLWTPINQTGSSISNLATGSYSVQVTDVNGCQATGGTIISVSGSLVVEVDPPFASISAGSNVQLTTTVNPTSSNLAYTWTPTSGLSCTDCPNPIASPNSTTTYIVSVESVDGCVGSDTVTITVLEDCGEYFMPTIFSPNGDLNNDELCVLGKCITSMSLKIYNRWGELVFESNNQNDCWDGTYKGAEANTGTYVYVLRLTFSNGDEIEENGNVSLVR
jgi:gliding motility-associated-like protein